jgi:hypothetical protein
MSAQGRIVLFTNFSVEFFGGIFRWNFSVEFFGGIFRWNFSVEFFGGIFGSFCIVRLAMATQFGLLVLEHASEQINVKKMIAA